MESVNYHQSIWDEFPHTLLRNKLSELWDPREPLILIDLGSDYHIAKFNLEENTNKVLHESPWFIPGNFISFRKWEPNLVPQQSMIIHTTIWARLPQLPTEFYEKHILEKVGENWEYF